MKERSSGKPAYKTPCPECNSSDARQVFLHPDGMEDAYCFACETYFPMDREQKQATVVPIERAKPMSYDKEFINSLPSKALTDRKIRQEIVERFNVKTALCEKDGKTIQEHYYPDCKDGKVVGYEIKQVSPKSFTSVGDRKGELDLWNQNKCPTAKKIFITEGRLDAMALYQTIIDKRPKKYSAYDPAVVSLTRGASGAVKDLLANKKFLDKYDEVILCFDQDDAGKSAVKEVLKVFPKYKVVSMSEKDACDMLLANKEDELYTAAVWDSEYTRQGEVVDVSDIISKAMERPKMGISFPWPTVTQACFGLRPHTLHCIGAAPKIGKTDHQHQLVHHLIYKENQIIGMFDLENSPVRTAKKIASKEALIDFTRPDKEYEDSLLHDTLVSLQGKVRFYDRGASRDWEDIRIAIEEMHLLDGINIFIIDPLTALISRYSSSEANDKLNEICTDMADLVQNFPITILCYSHVNPKPKSSKSHEQGGKVYSSEFTGSRAMEKWFHYGHGISRDRSDDCPMDRKNISEFYMLFDREFGQSYKCDVKFTEETVQYLEMRQW